MSCKMKALLITTYASKSRVALIKKSHNISSGLAFIAPKMPFRCCCRRHHALLGSCQSSCATCWLSLPHLARSHCLALVFSLSFFVSRFRSLSLSLASPLSSTFLGLLISSPPSPRPLTIPNHSAFILIPSSLPFLPFLRSVLHFSFIPSSIFTFPLLSSISSFLTIFEYIYACFSIVRRPFVYLDFLWPDFVSRPNLLPSYLATCLLLHTLIRFPSAFSLS